MAPKKTYFSVDVEAAGRNPETYSMLSIGACVVGRPTDLYYAELQPVHLAYLPESIRIGSLGLFCNPRNSASDPKTFSAERALANLTRLGKTPHEAMAAFCDWVRRMTGDTRPVLATDNPSFDPRFVNHYIEMYAGCASPFGHSAVSMGDLYRGITGDMRSNLKDLKKLAPPRGTFGVKHNALADARYNAAIFAVVLGMLRYTGLD